MAPTTLFTDRSRQKGQLSQYYSAWTDYTSAFTPNTIISMPTQRYDLQGSYVLQATIELTDSGNDSNGAFVRDKGDQRDQIAGPS